MFSSQADGKSAQRSKRKTIMAACLGVLVAVGLLFFLLGLPKDIHEVVLLSLWAIGTVTGVLAFDRHGLGSVAGGCIGGIVGVFASAWPWRSDEWQAYLVFAFLAGLSVVGSMIVACIVDLIVAGVSLKLRRK